MQFYVPLENNIAAVIQARTTDDVQRRHRQVMIRPIAWLISHGLKLVMHKTEVVLLSGQHIPPEMHVNSISIRDKSRQ